jgi:sugar phosphate isomerase/epimerase
MAKEGGYSIAPIYQGGYSTMDPTKSYGNVFTGYRVAAGEIGMALDPRSANILKDATIKASMGTKTFEVSPPQADIFESIPKGHLKEVNRLAKLTGMEATIHAPIVEASGMTKEGFTDANRQAAVRQMNNAIERANELNPDGSAPVTFHSSAILPGSMIEKGKKQPEETFAINVETGSINRLPIKEREFHGEGKATVDNEIAKINQQTWDHQRRNISYYADMVSDTVDKSEEIIKIIDQKQKTGQSLAQDEEQFLGSLNRVGIFADDSYRELKELFNSTYNNVGPEEQKLLKDFNNSIKGKVDSINENPNKIENLSLKKEIIEQGLEVFKKIQPPQMFESLENFSKEKTIQSFADVAWTSYDKYKDKAPIISIENPPAGGAFSRGEDLKDIVKGARKKFVLKAVEKGMSKSEAEFQAEKLLGVTWDVGHINMLRKYGYDNKDLIKETEQVKPLVKHIHLSDNFGLEHTELPMGMGNVPIKEIMKKLGKQGFEAKKIIEAGNWWQHFSQGGPQNSPFGPTLEAFGSSVYSSGGGPYWNQNLGFQQGYFGGYGMMLPQKNYETFGAGFSQLPQELGGQMPGAQGSRMGGRPME